MLATQDAFFLYCNQNKFWVNFFLGTPKKCPNKITLRFSESKLKKKQVVEVQKKTVKAC